LVRVIPWRRRSPRQTWGWNRRGALFLLASLPEPELIKFFVTVDHVFVQEFDVFRGLVSALPRASSTTPTSRGELTILFCVVLVRPPPSFPWLARFFSSTCADVRCEGSVSKCRLPLLIQLTVHPPDPLKNLQPCPTWSVSVAIIDDLVLLCTVHSFPSPSDSPTTPQ
jgi:hypothetical protein